jgi:hypothetical protein
VTPTGLAEADPLLQFLDGHSIHVTSSGPKAGPWVSAASTPFWSPLAAIPPAWEDDAIWLPRLLARRRSATSSSTDHMVDQRPRA